MLVINRSSTVETLVDQAAADLMQLLGQLQMPGGGRHRDGVARIVLTGGGAGIGLLEKIRELDEGQIDWSRVHVFFGDERNVALSDPESNERQARVALLDHVDLPPEHIHGYGLTGEDMTAPAAEYSSILQDIAPEGFDLHLLGMGGEGHINSLFPHTSAVAESEQLVVVVTDSPKPPAQRVTLTLPAVASAQRVWLLVSGANKAEAAAQVVAGADPADWPAAGALQAPETVLYLSQDAAGELPA
ncbi:6-phosphogluconolactonase [Corynebacterium alimapuense]|uniref:6-phosphogluconolactonase n=1 Tax=Corynebacterium alimapuense TaxID=1576874 RepID=A0A3M8K7R9_9CORY|nr:6-phosphogluconolactonase [Corynebacterium alimapuense]RNE49196.1 6-phosphogluconolactonase [Corynebacterium alimapuense]